MPVEHRQLARLRRLEGVRAIVRQTAANEAARAEIALGQLQALLAQSEALAAEYAVRTDAADGCTLRQLAAFGGGLQAVRRNTSANTGRAQVAADLRQTELANAERSRAAVQDRVAQATREIAAHAQPPVLAARRR